MSTSPGGRPGASPPWILHVDMDQFIAAVEVLRRPELADLPVVVGGRGDPTERGVVATASYQARAFGVGSGMPLRVAARKCPDAVFLPADKPAYDEASQRVMAVLRGLQWAGEPVRLQVLGWDEAFLGPRAHPEGTYGDADGDLGDPAELAALVRSEVLARTALHCSVGIGENRLQAKTATGFGKPRGSYRITTESWYAVMGDRPTRALWGVGKRTSDKLAALGIHTVHDLGSADTALLAAEIGPTMGPWYRRLGRGADTAEVDEEPWVARAHGHEETFQTDLVDVDEVAAAIRSLTRQALADIDAEGRPAQRVYLKIRFRPFLTFTRSRTLPSPTNDLDTLASAAIALLDRVEPIGEETGRGPRAVRLLGVRLEMTPPDGGY